MSNYTQTTFFTPKDSLPAGDPGKTIFGAAYDTEFGNIATAISSKPDPGTNASFLSLNVTGTTPPNQGIYSPVGGALGFAVNNGVAAGQIAGSGAWSIPAPTAAVALSITAASGKAALALSLPAAGNALTWTDGTHSGALALSATAGQEVQIGATADQGLGFFTNGTVRGAISNVGAWTINAPASGVALTAAGASSAQVLTLTSGNGPTTASVDFFITRAGSTANSLAQGPSIQLFDSTNSGGLILQNSGNQTEFWQINSGSWAQVARFGTDRNFYIRDDGGTLQVAGFRGAPINQQTANYTLQLSDRGKAVRIVSGSSLTLTVPANVFGAGDLVTIIGDGSASAHTIAQGAGLSLFWANGTNTSGNRTIAPVGIATLVFVSAAQAYISGSGLS